MNNTIGKRFTFSSLLQFTLPSIIMMIFMALYSIVDGIFVSRFIGTDALSAVNIVYPFINIIIALGVMLATGGSAIIARKMGENKNEEARSNFSFIVLCGIIAGIGIACIGILFCNPIIRLLGADESLMDYCRNYLIILLLFSPASILQLLFQNFFITAGKPTLGLILTILAGVFNAVFDYIFIVPMQMGISGAALATAIGYLIPAIFGIIYFFKKNKTLYFTKPKFDKAVLIESCFNGSSEMVTNLSTGIITFLFNLIMMQYLGTDGVAAMTIVLYTQFLFTALYLGFSIGVAPVISYNYGEQNLKQLQKLFQICYMFILSSSILICLFSLIFSKEVVTLFTPRHTNAYAITLNGFRLFSLNYLFAGFNIFTSSLFTALSNGKVSALVSFMRTLVFIVLGIMFLPKLFNINGVWLAVPFAEFACIFISIYCIYHQKDRYQYINVQSRNDKAIEIND